MIPTSKWSVRLRRPTFVHVGGCHRSIAARLGRDVGVQRQDWTLQGEWTWDAMAALDYAATLDAVDMERVAVCGLSTGGHLAMNVLALDDRVKAGVVGCVLSTWNHYARRVRMPPHCDCGIN